MMKGSFPWDNIFYSYTVTFHWYIAALVYNEFNNASSQLCPICIGTSILLEIISNDSNAFMQFAPISIPISCFYIILLSDFSYDRL